MITLTLIRTHSDDQGTVGLLPLPGAEAIRMVELPWRNNASNVSCIPPGRYRVTYMARSASGKYRDVYHVRAVNGRGGILIHGGNYAGNRDKGWRTHSWGCLLPALRVGRLPIGKGKTQRAGLASKAALARLHKATGRNAFELVIIDKGVSDGMG